MFGASIVIAISLFVFSPRGEARCTVDQAVFNPGHVEVEIRTPKKNMRGAILILPPTGGRTFLEGQYAKSLCKLGFKTLVMENWAGMNEKAFELSIHSRHLARGQKAIDSVVENLKTKNLGIIGTSVGAIHGATALGRVASIKAGFLIAGGGPIGEVIATAGEKGVKKLREARFKEMGFKSIAEYAQAINNTVPKELDALNYSEAIKSKKLNLVVSTKDTTVLSKHQENFVEAFEPEEVYEFDSNHAWTIIKTWWFHEDKIINFFDQHL